MENLYDTVPEYRRPGTYLRCNHGSEIRFGILSVDSVRKYFAGAVHDYFAGMLSLRNGGESLPEIIGRYLGVTTKQVMRGFTVVLMILVGAVFVAGPAGLLASLTPETLDTVFWIVVVFIYYILATLLPVDKIIGKIYPLFAIALLFMAVAFWLCST